MNELFNWLVDIYGSWSIPAMFWSFIVYIFMQVIALKKTKSIWRIAAFIPLLPMIGIVVITLIGLFQGSNLWPLLLLFTGPAAFLYMCVFFIALGLWQLKEQLRSNKSLNAGTPQSGAP